MSNLDSSISCWFTSFLSSTARGMYSEHLYELRSLVEENLIIAKSFVYVTGGLTTFLHWSISHPFNVWRVFSKNKANTARVNFWAGDNPVRFMKIVISGTVSKGRHLERTGWSGLPQLPRVLGPWSSVRPVRSRLSRISLIRVRSTNKPKQSEKADTLEVLKREVFISHRLPPAAYLLHSFPWMASQRTCFQPSSTVVSFPCVGCAFDFFRSPSWVACRTSYRS